MDRRVIVGILLLTLAWQGPALAYLTSLASPTSTGSGLTQCAGDQLSNANGCDDCCSHNSGSCMFACALSFTAAVPATPAPVVVRVLRFPAPHADRPALVEHDPASLL